MKKTIYAQTGEVKVAKKNTILKSNAIGSCIVITAYDRQRQIGALAHIMLPGKAPENRVFQKTRYASDAIDELIYILKLNGANENNIEVCLAGGANVLKRKDDNIRQDIIVSVEELLKKRKIKIKAKSLGGTERRSISLDLDNGKVYYSVGDGPEKLLWKFSGYKG